MNCACRTNSLKIFVQSLTELRVTDPIISRPFRPNHLSSPIAFRQAPIRHSARPFTFSAAAYSSGLKHQDNAESLSADRVEKETPIRATAETLQYDSPPPASTALPASGDELTAAKLNGAILDLSPESIDALIANLDQTSIAGQENGLEQRNNRQLDTQPESPRKSKPPVEKSQLKRLKIIKEDKPLRDPDEAWARQPEDWQIQKQALKEKFPEGWRPRKRLSPDALEGIRALHAQFPEQYTTEVLAKNFEVSPEAIRRILKGRWTPSAEEDTRRQERWFNRGKEIWSQMAELGTKPPRKWRREGVVRKPHWNEKKGPRTEYPYMPEGKSQAQDERPAESAHRRLSGSLL
ncbi:hypothetical protein F5B22DRAFT_442963 [Xylaria bambusicola]|uniref:uncharacterized protein n=1 Tax=Xylaria bambusicola TaxID=326684 RepID=UPI0020078A94|nr:uncharacterized protein F5B22DRAFT_442963 [Xylaria bambusicola]KAI0506608.1 hypothetical protein F5B22DRAFT_442963 [Xylaria bambusicola]